jgi:hypothetical protein
MNSFMLFLEQFDQKDARHTLLIDQADRNSKARNSFGDTTKNHV